MPWKGVQHADAACQPIFDANRPQTALKVALWRSEVMILLTETWSSSVSRRVRGGGY